MNLALFNRDGKSYNNNSTNKGVIKMKTVPLKNGQSFIVDDEDFDKVSEYSWHLFGAGYIGRSKSLGYLDGKQKNKTLYIHRFLTNAPDDKEVDHINGNKLDNRKSNLRFCNHSQNNAYRLKQSNNTSGFKGVSLHKATMKWRAYVKQNGKTTSLGYHKSAIEAARAYDKKALELFGEFAILNFSNG